MTGVDGGALNVFVGEGVLVLVNVGVYDDVGVDVRVTVRVGVGV